jgi:predicted AAA+ superfamily ATPase
MALSGVQDYIPRVVDQELDELLVSVSAVALDGPKGVGKTATAQRRARRVIQLDDLTERILLEADPARIDQGEFPLLIDEWQYLPYVWDRVRRSVDQHGGSGRFLLTGSAVPAVAPLHSGAGRIVSVRMRPLSLAERGLEVPTVSLAELLRGNRPAIVGRSSVNLEGYVAEIVASGFPAIRTARGRGQRALLDGYLRRIAERELSEFGVGARRPRELLDWLRAYAAATATTATYERISRAASPGEGDPPARSTVQGYRRALEQLWVLDPIPAWTPSRSPFSRLALAPKHHLADPALAARLLNATQASLLMTPAAGGSADLLGPLFESLVALSVRVYAQQAESQVAHFRGSNGQREVDLVVARADGRFVALEVKVAAAVRDDDVRNLLWLRERLGHDVLDAAVVTTGAEAYRRPDGIAVVPAALLGP